MDVLFDDLIFVHYGFMYLTPDDEEDPDFDDSKRGQRNGLLGAAVHGALMLMTGTHTGRLAVRVEWLDAEPEQPGAGWADVVEASIDIVGPRMRLAAFDAFAVAVPRTGEHRARYSAAGMADGTDADVGDAEPRDRYLLQLWPAPWAPDRIVRVGSSRAQYWHDEAQSLEPDPMPAEPTVRTGYEPWTPDVARGQSFEDALRSFPGSLQMMVTAAAAKVVCRRVGIDRAPLIAAHLAGLHVVAPLPDALEDVEQVVAGLEQDAAREGRAPATEAITAALRALFLATDSSTALEPQIAFRNGLVAYDGDAEALFRDICAELGYPYERG